MINVTFPIFTLVYINRVKRFLIYPIILLLVLFLPGYAFAQSNFRSGNSVVLPAGQIVEKDYFASGQDVSIDGTVNGDAYMAGGNVTLNGTVNGDLLAVGGNITLNGEVTGNVRIAGGNITVNGKIGRNVTAAGGSIIIASGVQIAGSVTSAGGNLNLLGDIGKNANLAGGQVNIADSVNGDVNAAVGQLTFSPQAKVNGNVIYWSEKKATLSPQSSVSGIIKQNIPPKRLRPKAYSVGKTVASGIITAVKVMSFLTALIIGLLLLKLFPTATKQISQTAKNNMLLSLGAGFLALAVTPFAVIMLLITFVGIPLAILWIIFVVFDLWLAKIFIALALGMAIAGYFKQKWGAYLALLLGLIVYYIIGIIPVIGWLFTFFAGIIGFGAIILTKKNYFQNLQKKKLL